MNRRTVRAAVFLSVIVVFICQAQTKSGLQLFDSTGRDRTAKFGWTGNAINGNFYIQTIGDVNGVAVKQGVLSADKFSGDGSGLLRIPLLGVDGLVDSMRSKADSAHVHPYMIDGPGSASGQAWKWDQNARRGIWGTVTAPAADSAGIQSGAVRRVHLANGVVDSTKLATASVSRSKIVARAVAGAQIDTTASVRVDTLTARTAIGVGTRTPSYPVDVETGVQGVFAKFGRETPVYIGALAGEAGPPYSYIGFNYRDVAYGKSSAASYFSVLGFDAGTGVTSLSTSTTPGTEGAGVSDGVCNLFMTKDGQVGIGLDSVDSTLTVTGSGHFTGNVLVNGRICASNVACPSDIRLKTNIQPINLALDIITSLKGITYEWKQTAFPEKHLPSGRQAGVIAQDVEKVFPVAVNTEADGYKTVAYDNLVPLLIEGMKEQQAQIEALKARVSELEGRSVGGSAQ